MALHEIFLVTVFGLYFFSMFIRGDCTDSHPCWYRIYNRFSGSVEHAKVYVHILRRRPVMSLHPQPIAPVPEQTVRVAVAAFPKGNPDTVGEPLAINFQYSL